MQRKISTKEDYLQRINIVVEYTNNHLSENIDLKTLASVSNFSPFHFQRIMKAFLGEPIGSFIVRMRMGAAAQLIRHTDLPIQEIAMKVGYNMPSSLSKVFKQIYGISPTEYRTNKDYVIMKPSQANSNLELEYNTVDLKSFRIVYIQLFGDYMSLDYCNTYGKLLKYVSQNNVPYDSIEYICIYYNDPKTVESDKLRTDCCLTIDRELKPENEIGVKMIEGGKFIVFRYKGGYKNLAMVYDTIYAKYLPEIRCVLRNTFSFEKYLNDSQKAAEDDLLTEIYIPIE